VQRRGVRDLPAEAADALAAVLRHHHPLLAVVHAQRERLGALVDELHSEEPGAVAGPVLERLGVHADISETLNIHGPPPLMGEFIRNMALPAALGNCRAMLRAKSSPATRPRGFGCRQPG